MENLSKAGKISMGGNAECKRHGKARVHRFFLSEMV